MDLYEYLAKTHETAIYPSAGTHDVVEQVYLALGLANEGGEATGCVKKILRAQSITNSAVAFSKIEEERKKLREELGDVMWYWVRLAWAAGFEIDEILEQNVRKLQDRKAAGTLNVR